MPDKDGICSSKDSNRVSQHLEHTGDQYVSADAA